MTCKILAEVKLLAVWLFACFSVAVGEQKIDAPVVFSLKAPQANKVELCGEWAKQNIPLNRGDDGTWSVSLESVPAGIWQYSFSVDGVKVLDPSSLAITPQPEFRKSVLQIPSVPPAPWDWQDIPHGTLHTHEYQSKALDTRRELAVYTPPGYEADSAKRFPLLVLQHGAGGNQFSWIERGKAHWILDHLIDAGKARPMIILMMNGHSGELASPGDKARRARGAEAFRRELFEDAIPLLERNYRLAAGREHRAIVGLSMGGWQSLTIGLGALDRFAWVGAFSSSADVEAVQPVLDAPRESDERLRLLWLACGRNDPFLKGNEAIVGALSSSGIHNQWHLTDGGHSWPVWRGYLVAIAPLLFQE